MPGLRMDAVEAGRSGQLTDLLKELAGPAAAPDPFVHPSRRG